MRDIARTSFLVGPTLAGDGSVEPGVDGHEDQEHASLHEVCADGQVREGQASAHEDERQEHECSDVSLLREQVADGLRDCRDDTDDDDEREELPESSEEEADRVAHARPGKSGLALEPGRETDRHGEHDDDRVDDRVHQEVTPVGVGLPRLDDRLAGEGGGLRGVLRGAHDSSPCTPLGIDMRGSRIGMRLPQLHP